jgi:hypothetical protein
MQFLRTADTSETFGSTSLDKRANPQDNSSGSSQCPQHLFLYFPSLLISLLTSLLTYLLTPILTTFLTSLLTYFFKDTTGLLMVLTYLLPSFLTSPGIPRDILHFYPSLLPYFPTRHPYLLTYLLTYFSRELRNS